MGAKVGLIYECSVFIYNLLIMKMRGTGYRVRGAGCGCGMQGLKGKPEQLFVEFVSFETESSLSTDH
jgi:hypothetical protein